MSRQPVTWLAAVVMLAACGADRATGVESDRIRPLQSFLNAANPPGQQKKCDLVSVAPQSATLTFAGAQVQLTGTALDKHGRAVDRAIVAWSSSNSGVAAVSSTGLVTAVSEGTATITGTCGELGSEGSAVITVDLP
jgi:hypothetical protein